MNYVGKPTIKTITKEHNRCFIIGDLHGMYDDAMKLLELCDVNDDDLVIFVGDLIDRGPNNDKCIELAMRYESVTGNHESKHISYEESNKVGRLNIDHIHPQHKETRDQLTEYHHEYMKNLPHVITVPKHNIAVVHGGCFPGINLEDQQIGHLLHLQMVNPEVSMASKWPSKAPNDWVFWANLWAGKERIVFGHTVLNKPAIGKNAVGIDCGIVFGGSLVAFDASTDETKIVGDKRITDDNKIRMYQIFENVFAYS